MWCYARLFCCVGHISLQPMLTCSHCTSSIRQANTQLPRLHHSHHRDDCVPQKHRLFIEITPIIPNSLTFPQTSSRSITPNGTTSRHRTAHQDPLQHLPAHHIPLLKRPLLLSNLPPNLSSRPFIRSNNPRPDRAVPPRR